MEPYVLSVVLLTVLGGLAVNGSAGHARSGPPSQGNPKAERSFSQEATVNAPPAEVFRLWTTREGIQKFFALDAKIDPRAGGQ